jgi:ADP-ribose pyrophosphatase YjhB (NUDIX family)
LSAHWFRDDGAIADDVDHPHYEVPRIPASVGALIFDAAGRLLVLKPNYKKGWTIPGGQMDATGETPWEACLRETLEECGLEPASGRLVCVDFRRPRPNRPGGMRFLFDCGSMTDEQLSAIRLQAEEIDEHRLAELDEALALLSGPIRRRVAAGVGAKRCVYLEDGRPVEAVLG